MKTYAICPISDKRINENVARSNAIITVAILTAYVLTSNLFIISFLFIDFLLRGLELSKYSPVALLSKKIVQKLKPKIINAGPKIFAARIGAFFSISILLATLTGFNVLAISLAGIFGTCAFLEAAFGFCIACEIYPFVYKLFYESKLNSIK
jgi:hypothetical protein